jgi:hypothetical protein
VTVRRIASAVLAVAVLSACAGNGPATTAPASSAPVTSPADVAGQLLPAVAAYVDAVNGKNLDALVDAFAPNGEVVDVGRRFAGRAAIRGWADREVIGGTLTVTGVAEQRTGYQRLLVRFAPGGTGGFAAYYAFTVDHGAITRADLTYAT